jgi:hypothetical protein
MGDYLTEKYSDYKRKNSLKDWLSFCGWWSSQYLIQKNMDSIKEIELKSGRTLQIIQDTSPESPREWDNLGIMAAFHNRYTLGDRQETKGKCKAIVTFSPDDFENWDEMEKHIREVGKAVVVLPLYLYDHSGITMNTTGFSCGWDSGRVGFIYTTQAKLNEMGTVQGNGDGILDEESDEQFNDRLKRYLVQEVKTYDQYLTGDIYGFRLVEKSREESEDMVELSTVEIDSCWGFYGDDPKENGMLEHLSEEDQPIDEL